MIRWTAYALMTVSLGAAVLLRGGVYAAQWKWTAWGITLAAVLTLWESKGRSAAAGLWELRVMAFLLGWMLFQLVPLPPGLVENLSPLRWSAVAAARKATGADMRQWVALSAAPSASFERLLYVIPAMAAFVTMSEMARWWRDQVWIPIAPIIGCAWLESVLGLMQFDFGRFSTGVGAAVSGTYVSHNHFAGIVEMGFPPALLLAITLVRRSRAAGSDQTTASAAGAAIMMVVAACLLMGVLVSQSRMAFVSTVAATLAAIVALLWPERGSEPGRRGSLTIRWVIPVFLAAGVLVVLLPRELIDRFASLGTDEGGVTAQGRVEIWRETLGLISGYRWTGCGVGAYERGFYLFKNVAPVNTVDFAHCDYLQVVAELGIPGALLAGALGVLVLGRMMRSIFSGRRFRNRDAAIGVMCAILALATHSVADFNLYIPANALALAWLFGIASGMGVVVATRNEFARPHAAASGVRS